MLPLPFLRVKSDATSVAKIPAESPIAVSDLRDRSSFPYPRYEDVLFALFLTLNFNTQRGSKGSGGAAGDSNFSSSAGSSFRREFRSNNEVDDQADDAAVSRIRPRPLRRRAGDSFRSGLTVDYGGEDEFYAYSVDASYYEDDFRKKDVR